MTTRRMVLAGIGMALASSVGACGPSYRPLFDGRTLEGWRPVGDARWFVEDGQLVGVQGPGGKAGDLYTSEQFGDFELTAKFKLVWPGNSGIWFRFDPPRGYQFDILEWPKPVCFAGTLYCTQEPKLFLAMNTDKSLVRYDDWNDAYIMARGDHIVMRLNGRVVADVHDTRYTRGSIGLQVHAGEDFKHMQIRIKDIRIRALDAPGS